MRLKCCASVTYLFPTFFAHNKLWCFLNWVPLLSFALHRLFWDSNWIWQRHIGWFLASKQISFLRARQTFNSVERRNAGLCKYFVWWNVLVDVLTYERKVVVDAWKLFRNDYVRVCLPTRVAIDVFVFDTSAIIVLQHASFPTWLGMVGNINDC